MSFPGPVRRCPLCQRMRPAAKLDRHWHCKDTKRCARARADLDKILAEAPSTWRRDNWAAPSRPRRPWWS